MYLFNDSIFKFFNNDTNLSNLKLSNILFLPVFNNFL